MTYEEFIKARIKSDTLDGLRASLSDYHVSHIRYCCFHSFEFESQLSRAYAREVIEPSKAFKMKYLFSGCDKVLKALYNYYHKHYQYDLNYFHPQSEHVEMYRPDLNNIKLQGMFDDFTIAGAFSSAFYFVESSGIIGAFYLCSTLPPKQSEKFLCSGKLEPLLTAAHYKLYKEHQSDLNPWINLGLLNKNSQQVLIQLGDGKKLDDIAKELNITKRGVDYHLSHLKTIFEAKSNCNLIAKAMALGAIDGSSIKWK